MSIFFTADLHLGHTKIIEYANRPYRNAEEMNEALVRNWNDKVGPRDLIYVIGDVGFMPPEPLYRIVQRLQGRKHLVRGNHDHKMPPEVQRLFIGMTDYTELRLGREYGNQYPLIVLSHYPFATWNKAHHGSWNLHGHSHGNYRNGRPDTTDGGRILDVGVDCHDYRPISLEEVAAIMAKKVFRAVDHHGDKRK